MHFCVMFEISMIYEKFMSKYNKTILKNFVNTNRAEFH